MFHREQKWGLNTYLYAPKDDYKHRMYWRDLYSAEEAGEFHLFTCCPFSSSGRKARCLLELEGGLRPAKNHKCAASEQNNASVIVKEPKTEITFSL